MNIPTLRFKRFSEELKALKMKDFLSIGSGRDYKHLRSGDVPVYGTGGLLTMVDDFLYEGETVCIGRKGTIDKPLFHTGKIWTVDTLFYTHSFKNIYPHFVYLLFQRVNWKQHNEAGGVPSLAKSTIENIQFNIPSLEEQKKVSRFFSVIDKKLDSLKKKKELLEQYKKGVMQKIFSQELRFKDEEGKDFPAWEEKKLGEVCDYKNGGSFEKYVCEEGLYNLISLNSIDINGRIKPNHKRSSISDGSLQKGDLIMVLSDVAHGNFLGLTDIVPGDNFVLNQRMAALKLKIDVDRFYLKTFINKNQSYFKLMGQGSSQLNLSKGDVENFIIKLPSLPEQGKIAQFLSSLDAKINLAETQIQKTELWKKGLLQQMFV